MPHESEKENSKSPEFSIEEIMAEYNSSMMLTPKKKAHREQRRHAPGEPISDQTSFFPDIPESESKPDSPLDAFADMFLNIEKQVALQTKNIPDVEKSAPLTEKNIPDIEKSAPLTEKNIPDIEKSAPLTEKNIPDVERVAASQSENIPNTAKPTVPQAKDSSETDIDNEPGAVPKRGMFSRRGYDDQPETNKPQPTSEQFENVDFSKHFSPSDTFVGDEHPPDMPSEPADTDTSDESVEDTGTFETQKHKKRMPEEYVLRAALSPEDAAKPMTLKLRMMRLRCVLAMILCLPQIYIVFAPRLDLWLPEFLKYISVQRAHSYRVYLLIAIILLVLTMLMSIEIIALGLRGFFRLRPGSESLVTLSAFVSIFHAVSILLFPKWGGYMPYCSVASVLIFFSMWGLYLKQSGFRSAYKTAAVTNSPYVLCAENDVVEDMPAAVKTPGDTEGFVALSESGDGASRVYSFIVPLLIAASIVFAAMVSFGAGQRERFLWAFSAILSGAAPFSMLLCLNLPMSIAAHRLSHCGAALAGYFGVRSFAKKGAVIVGDTDLFPPGTVFLNGLKVFGNYSIERVISYTASMITASGSGLTKVFTELLNEQSGALRTVEHFCHYEGGGTGAEINADRVLVGSSDFLTRMGISLPRGINMKSAVLIAINQELAGVFAINYAPSRSIKNALHLLVRHKMHIVLSVVDFNITPVMIKQKFKLSTDDIDYPTIEERIGLAGIKRGAVSKTGAILAREGLVPFAEAVIAARRVSLAYRGNMFFSIVCSVLGILLMFFLTHSFAPGAITPSNVMLFHGLLTVPVLLISGWVDRY